jgi:hypothetical protein
VVVLEFNSPPTAVPDFYSIDERTTGLGDLAVEPEAGTFASVLGNDSDGDTPPDPLEVFSHEDPTNQGDVEFAEDGTFVYTPFAGYEWGTDEFSRFDTFEYTVSDGRGGSDTALVTITVHRVVCAGETVSDIDGLVQGSFTLLDTEFDPCKRYEVDASQGETAEDDRVTLSVPGDGNLATFRGVVTFSPKAPNPDGSIPFLLEYDPDLDGPAVFKPVPICLPPFVFVSGLIESAVIPEGDTWCNAGWSANPSTDFPGLVVVEIQLYGVEDPVIRFR